MYSVHIFTNQYNFWISDKKYLLYIMYTYKLCEVSKSKLKHPMKKQNIINYGLLK